MAAKIQSFIKYPSRQKVASFNLDDVMWQLERASQVDANKSTEVLSLGFNF